MFPLLPPCREYPFLETETERRMPGSSHRKLPRSSHASSPTLRPSCQLSDYPVKSTFKNYSTTSLQSHNQSFLTPKGMILFLTCTLNWLSLKEGQCLLHSGNEEWEITFLFQVQTGSLRSHFPICLHFKVNTYIFFLNCLYKKLLKFITMNLFSKSFIMIIQVSGSDFHIQVWSVHCVNYHEQLCMQKAGVWNVLPTGQRNVGGFLKTWHLSASIQCETTDTAFSVCIKKKERKRVRPFLCSNKSSLYPVVYKLSTQVGSVFGYPLVQIENWQASWKLLLTLCIINWLKKKSLQYSKTILFSPQEVYLKQFSTCVPQHTKKGQENIPLQLWYFLTVQEN